MPRVNGIYSLPPSYKAVSGQTIRTEQHNPPLEDIAAALTASLPRDGSAAMTGNLPMGANKITGIAAATNNGDVPRYDQVTRRSDFLASLATRNLVAGHIPFASDDNVAGSFLSSSYARGLMASTSQATFLAAIGFPAATEYGRFFVSLGTPLAARNHIGLDGVNVVAGAGLSGGGAMNQSRTINLNLPLLAFKGVASAPNVPIMDMDDNTQGRVGPGGFKTLFGVADVATTISAGAGLTGGGNLGSNMAIAMGQPSSITASTTNSASGNTHTHNLPAAEFRIMVATYLAAGQEGEYAFASWSGTGSVLFGNTVAGSTLVPAGERGANTSRAPNPLSGTWRCLGFVGESNTCTLWKRIS